MKKQLLFYAAHIYFSMSAMQLETSSQAHFVTYDEIEPVLEAVSGRKLQISVANQFSMSGAQATCGYQALYNGLEILFFIISLASVLFFGMV